MQINQASVWLQIKMISLLINLLIIFSTIRVILFPINLHKTVIFFSRTQDDVYHLLVVCGNSAKPKDIQWIIICKKAANPHKCLVSIPPEGLDRGKGHGSDDWFDCRKISAIATHLGKTTQTILVLRTEFDRQLLEQMFSSLVSSLHYNLHYDPCGHSPVFKIFIWKGQSYFRNAHIHSERLFNESRVTGPLRNHCHDT